MRDDVRYWVALSISKIRRRNAPIRARYVTRPHGDRSWSMEHHVVSHHATSPSWPQLGHRFFSGAPMRPKRHWQTGHTAYRFPSL